jgi:hypothetical protein
MSTNDEIREQLLAQADPDQAATILRRAAVAQRVCRERGWDIDDLTIVQAMEIRADPEWDEADTSVKFVFPPEAWKALMSDPRERAAYDEYRRRIDAL